MTDIRGMKATKNWDEKYCDFCRSNIDPKWEDDGHEDWCPVLEVLRLRAALEDIMTAAMKDLNQDADWTVSYIYDKAKEALDD